MRSLWLRSLITGIAMTTAAAGVAAAAPAAAPPVKQCAQPGASGFESASPEEVDLDPAAVREAVDYASTHLRTTVQVFRNNCRVASGPLDPVTDRLPWNVWSSTKSVVSMLTGIAADQRKLALDDPIGRYLPAGPGWGDDAHRAITIRNLITQTSGLQESIFSETATTGADQNIAQEALAQPVIHPPGSQFAYGQRNVDLLAYVVQRAVGTDLQDFAQQYLFTPLGIPRSSHVWLRDRSGNTYGYAHLFIQPEQYAKLGLLMQNHGAWNGHRIISADYTRSVAEPTKTNGCYGMLFWTNAGAPCTSGPQTVERNLLPSAPPDLYAMIGAFHQNNFIIPSLNMTVTWTGLLGDTTTNLAGLLSGSPNASDLYYNFFRILMRGVRDQHIPDPGPYTEPTQDFDTDPLDGLDPSVLLHDLAANPDCNVLVCDGTIPTRGLAQNGEAVTRAVLAPLTSP